jgi:hypothetical protein
MSKKFEVFKRDRRLLKLKKFRTNYVILKIYPRRNVIKIIDVGAISKTEKGKKKINYTLR